MSPENSSQKRVYFHVEGDKSSGAGVQGVGFRYFTREHAQAYKITGWVRNKSDGNVEGEAQGGEREMAKFLKDIEKGPRGASVKKVEQEDREVATAEAAFEVRH
ncbi:hypothetical protein N0V93_001155 [Gnomoniopsis smithogilvyi]|uniref:acylphosphatase n=1 Tax=Gnomoniopsis smithogilvyi TaxID=1191159 RepID=A0A9W9D1E2_9PEZI|nr:hypothetical protein N0V93_001155 [Gnomoniopsis smithogilvyi]